MPSVWGPYVLTGLYVQYWDTFNTLLVVYRDEVWVEGSLLNYNLRLKGSSGVPESVFTAHWFVHLKAPLSELSSRRFGEVWRNISYKGEAFCALYQVY